MAKFKEWLKKIPGWFKKVSDWVKARPWVLIIVALGGALLFTLCSVSGCSSGEESVNGEAPAVAGLYTITTGTQHIIDSTGADDLTDLTGLDLVAGVAQDGDIVEFFGCMGKYTEGTVRCDTYGYGIDGFFGPFYKLTQGKIVFDGDQMNVKLQLFAEYPWADYSGTNELQFDAVYDKDLTDEAGGNHS